MSKTNIDLGAWDKGNKESIPIYCKFCGHFFTVGDTLSIHMKDEHELYYNNCLIRAVPEFLENLAGGVTNVINETDPYKHPEIFKDDKKDKKS
jgi:hypothetical protein